MDKIKLDDYQVSVLLEHVSKGAGHPKVGFEHSTMTIEKFLAKIKVGEVDVDHVESALWSCNLLKEVNEFTGPDFDYFVDSLTPVGHKFDKFFNYFVEK